MAENRVIEKNEAKTGAKSVSGKGSLFTQMEKKLAFDNLFSPENQSKYLFRFIWIVSLCMLYIYNSHVSERFDRGHDRLVKRVEDLRTHSTTLHADLMIESKESEIVKKVAAFGLTDDTAPKKIIVE